jgi:hypothetical protein
MEDVGIFYGHLAHFTVFCFILWTFGVVRGNLVYISHFGILYKEKSGNPDLKSVFRVYARPGNLVSLTCNKCFGNETTQLRSGFTGSRQKFYLYEKSTSADQRAAGKLSY